MKPSRKLLRSIYSLVAAIVFIAIGYVVLAQTSVPHDFAFLRGQQVKASGIRTAAYRDDVFEPFEYVGFNWQQEYTITRAKMMTELQSKGFRVLSAGPTYAVWQLDDLQVNLYAIRSPGSRWDAPQIDDSSWSFVFIRRAIDYQWLTQFRVWLFDSRSDE